MTATNNKSSAGEPSTSEKKSTTKTGGKYEESQSSKKIVIRRLPPTLTQEQFLDIVSPLPEYEFFYYCNADPRWERLKKFISKNTSSQH